MVFLIEKGGEFLLEKYKNSEREGLLKFVQYLGEKDTKERIRIVVKINEFYEKI